MIQIFRNNKPFFYIEDICEGSKLSRQLMDHHYIVLKFSTASPVYFEIGDSVEIADFGLFVLTSAYFPKYNETTDGYDYELQMDAYYMSWKNKVCKYRPQYGANETSFKLTTSVSVHLNVVLSNLKALNYKYHNKDFSVDYTTYNKDVFDIEKRFLVEYSSMSIYDALNTICESLDCEWWVDGSVIYLGYCEMTGQTTFEQGVNMLSMSQTESKSSYITRLYAFGSDKNIPSGYFTGSEVDVTTDGVATDYLMLPNKDVDDEGYYSKNGYIENINVVKNEAQAIEGVVLFEDEYPKLSCTVSSIKTYNSTVENENGDITTATFWQVSSSDSFATNFSSSWIKQGLTLMIKFESGALMGMEFEVNFKTIERVNYFEIVANDTYGRTLPDSVMCPKIGDKFFLYNWDATKITETNLISEAQEALYVRAKNYYKKSMVDNSNFTCVLDSEKFFNFGTYNFHPMGEQVKLINPLFSETDKDGKHYRNSRIIGMELNLDIPYDSPKYIVGEKAAYSRLGQLEDKVNSITVNGQQIGGASGGGGVYVIGMNDTTPETDSNVYSARRTRNSFLSKLNPDTAQKVITFMEGLKVGNGGKGIDDKGNAVLGDVVLDRVHDPHSTEADRTIIGAQGFDLYMGVDGKSHMYIDYLTTRVKMFAAGAEIRKVSYSGGTTIFSNAGSTIGKVAYVMDANGEKVIAYKCYAAADDGTTRTMNWWRPGMMAMCQTFNVKAQTEGELANRYYWRLVVAVGQETLEDGRLYDYVVLSNVERFYGREKVVPSYGLKLLADGTGKVLTFGGAAVAVAAASGLTSLGAVLEQDGVTMDDYDFSVSGRNYAGYEPAEGGGEPDAPMAGDVIVQVGDQVKWLSRGNAIKLSTSTEDDASGTAPAIAMYHGIGNYADENGKEDLSTIWKWRALTFLASPAMTYVNSDNFKFFTKGDIEKAYDVTDRFTKIEGNVEGITTTVEKTKKTVDGVETRVSTVEQKADSIKLEVDTKINGLNDGLIATGINVTSKQITLTAERTSFRTNSGEDVAVFNEDGLNVDLINVKHLWAVNKDGTKKVGYFGNYETAECEVGSEYAPLFVGSSTAAEAPFYVTSTGKIFAMAGNIGSFAIQGGKLHEEDNEGSTTMDLGSYNLDFMDNSEDGNPRTNRFSLTMGNVAMIDTFGAVVSGGITLNKFRDFDTTSTNLYDPQVNIGLKVSVQGDVSQTIRESYQTLSSGYLNGNHALFISKGDIAGMRPVLTVATTHRALSKMECVVVCRAGVTLTLPKDPEIGQYYKIIKASSSTVTMAIDTDGGDTKKITYWYNAVYSDGASLRSKTADKCPLDRYVQDAELFFDGTEWQCRQHGYVQG